MMVTIYFKIRDFPVLPLHLKLEALNATKGQDLRQVRDLYATRNDPGEQAGCICAFTEIPNLRKWFNETIRPLCDNAAEEREVFVQTIGPEVQIHRDPARRRVLNYIIDTGGESVVTEHYSDDKQTRLHSVCIPKDTWHELETYAFHSVVGHTRKRIGLTYVLLDQHEVRFAKGE